MSRVHGHEATRAPSVTDWEEHGHIDADENQPAFKRVQPIDGDGNIIGGSIVKDGNNSTDTPLSASATFTGTSTEVLAYNQQHVTLFFRPNEVPSGDGSTAKASLYLEYSPDETNWDISVPVLVRSGLNIPKTLITVDRYFRVRYLNDGGASAISDLGLDEAAGTPVDQTAFRLNTYLVPTGTKDLSRTIDQTVSGSDPVVLGRSVNMGLDPDGDYRNMRAMGRDNNNSTTTPLSSSATYRGTWFQWQDTYVGAAIEVDSDVAGTIHVDFSNQVTPTNGDESDVDDTLQISFSPGNGTFRRHVPLQSRWFRLRYINGGTGQSTFSVDTTFLSAATPLVMQALKESVSEDFLAGLVQSSLIAPNSSDVYDKIKRSDTNSGLQVSVAEHEVDTPIQALTDYQTNQANVGTTAVQLAGTPLSGRKSILVKNLSSSSKTIFIGNSSSVTSSNGYELAAGEGITLEISDSGDDVWAISSSGTQRACWIEIA